MPIKVRCQCGQRFSARDELAGKTLKCPKCAKPLVIKAAPATADTSVAQLLEEAGLGTYVESTRRCPQCDGDMPEEAILCIRCGYNEKLGRRMKTRVMAAESDDEDGWQEEESLGNEMLDNAVRTMRKDQQQQEQLTKDLPWWVYLIVLLAIVTVAVAMMFLPQSWVMTVSLWVVIVTFVGIGLYAYVRVALVAFEENSMQGLLTLLTVVYWPVYCFLHLDRCQNYLLILVGAFAVAGCLWYFVLPLLG